MMDWCPRCYIPSFVEIGPPVLEKKILKGFYHIWVWRPSWSCDPDAANKLSFPLPKEAPLKFGFDWPSGFGGEDYNTALCILTLSSQWYEKGDVASLSINEAGRALLVKILISLEPCDAFGSNFEYLCTATGMQNGDEASSSIILVD